MKKSEYVGPAEPYDAFLIIARFTPRCWLLIRARCPYDWETTVHRFIMEIIYERSK
jgi:hypothetical protein